MPPFSPADRRTCGPDGAGQRPARAGLFHGRGHRYGFGDNASGAGRATGAVGSSGAGARSGPFRAVLYRSAGCGGLCLAWPWRGHAAPEPRPQLAAASGAARPGGPAGRRNPAAWQPARYPVGDAPYPAQGSAIPRPPSRNRPAAGTPAARPSFVRSFRRAIMFFWSVAMSFLHPVQVRALRARIRETWAARISFPADGEKLIVAAALPRGRQQSVAENGVEPGLAQIAGAVEQRLNGFIQRLMGCAQALPGYRCLVSAGFRSCNRADRPSAG